MIPETISREHVLQAIREIDRTGVPAQRHSTRYSLLHNGERYPPKYVISLAHRFAQGYELDPSSFSGGVETNSFLRAIGFDIIGPQGQIDEGRSTTRHRQRKETRPAQKRDIPLSHDERCQACKVAIRTLLEKLYGQVLQNPVLDVPTTPNAIRHTRFGEALTTIFQALRGYRGFQNFVRAATLPRSDWLVRRPGFVVEFDESQHFTKCRAISLEWYPDGLVLGYDRQLWLERCQNINAKDNDPAYRDEQRAWYDTLRDFLPDILDFMPTVRLYAGERRDKGGWCSLDADSTEAVETFRQILSDRLSFWEIGVRSVPDPEAARIVIDGQWNGDVDLARSLLEDVAASWPPEKRVKFLTTCGAFLTFDWPTSLPYESENLFPNESALEALRTEAKKSIDALLTARLVEKLASHTHYLSVGIDSYKTKISQTQNSIPEPHVELVYLIDLRSGTYHFTGKSYPTPGQERGILRNPDLASHMVDTEYGKALVLGCHDLSIFNPRSRSNRMGWRKTVADEWVKSIQRDAPLIVLHHPHTTVKTRTWAASWKALQQAVPSVRLSLGAGSYSIRDTGWGGRNRLENVLTATSHGATLDFVARIGAFGA